MGIEGRLTVKLQRRPDGPARVHIGSTRPVHACGIFHGRTVDDTLALVPLLFGVCATAQACAAVRACERALGRPADAVLERLRDRLVAAESLREHLWRIFLEWPESDRGGPDRSVLAGIGAIQRGWRQALAGTTEPFLPGGAVPPAPDPEVVRELERRQERLLHHHLFGIPSRRWLELESEADLSAWARESGGVAAAAISRLLGAGWAGVGRCRIAPLPSLQEERLHRAMADARFVTRPRWEGECRETSCLTRNVSPLLDALERDHGNGLLTRLVARLTEVARLARRLASPAVEASIEEAAPANPAIGRAEAARGRLLHRVCLERGRIARYQILAPTEWNFHPDGVVARALGTLGGERDRVRRQASLLIGAIDPCVAWDLTVT